MQAERDDGAVSAREVAEVCDAWRRSSLAHGWHATDDWACAEATAVVTGLWGDEAALSGACGLLGRARAQAGVGVAETIADLAALFGALGAGEPPLPLICAVAEGWAEEGLAQQAQGHCEDPLSGLVTLPYLRTRLAEVYRAAAQNGTSPADTHRLLTVTLPRRPDPWRRMALVILLGRDLRAEFPGGETLALAWPDRPGPVLSLVRTAADLPLRFTRLRRTVGVTFGAQIKLTPLPGRVTDALRLVDALAR